LLRAIPVILTVKERGARLSREEQRFYLKRKLSPRRFGWLHIIVHVFASVRSVGAEKSS